VLACQTFMPAAVVEVLNPAQVAPIRKKKPRGVAEAVIPVQVAPTRKKLMKEPPIKIPARVAEVVKLKVLVALMKKRPTKTPLKKPLGKVAEAD